MASNTHHILSPLPDKMELLAYSYRYTRIRILLSEFDDMINSQLIAPSTDRDTLNLHVRFILNHPMLNDQYHYKSFYYLLVKAFEHKVIDQSTSVKIVEQFPQFAPVMIPQTPKALQHNTPDALKCAIEYPQMFLLNIHKTHIAVSIAALQNSNVIRIFHTKSYTERMTILQSLFVAFKTTRDQLDGLFTILATSGNLVNNIYQSPTDESIDILLFNSSLTQRKHHVLLAWSGKFISDARAIELLGSKDINHEYEPVFYDLIAAFKSIALTYKTMISEIDEQQQFKNIVYDHIAHPVDY